MNTAEALEVLSRTPAALDGMLRGISDGWGHTSTGEGVWSPFDIVGHLNHGERTDWVPRARLILDHADSRPFEPYDREGMFAGSASKTLDQLLDEFIELRAANVEAIGSLEPPLDARGLHPDLGPVTMGQLIATWAAHDMVHIAQAAEIMAKRYREAVGPWRARLPALDRPDVVGD